MILVLFALPDETFLLYLERIPSRRHFVDFFFLIVVVIVALRDVMRVRDFVLKFNALSTHARMIEFSTIAKTGRVTVGARVLLAAYLNCNAIWSPVCLRSGTLRLAVDVSRGCDFRI